MCVCLCLCVYLCVCVGVCVCVCVCERYSPNGLSDFDNNPHNTLRDILLVLFLSFFENSTLMTSLWPLSRYSFLHSYVFNIAFICFI